jgi:FkbM family methyltransferase
MAANGIAASQAFRISSAKHCKGPSQFDMALTIERSRWLKSHFLHIGCFMNFSRLRELAVLHLVGTPIEEPLRQARALRYTLGRPREPQWDAVRSEGQTMSRIFKKLITPDMNCIDIGCHLGSILYDMRRNAPHGRHMAFEPTPYKHAWLKHKYPDVEVRPEAVSDSTGDAEFFHLPNHSGFSGLHQQGDADWKRESFKVKTTRLDDVVGDRAIGFIKIDVEGAEPLVIRGAERTIRKWQPHLIFECSLLGLQNFGWTPEQMYHYLTGDLGYALFIPHEWLSEKPALSVEGFITAMSYPAQAFSFFATPRAAR